MTHIKQKIIKASTRGITFSDKDLGTIGEKFTYCIEKDAKRITILKTVTETAKPQGSGTISRKKQGSTYVPLIDIRSQKTKIFQNAEYLVVRIYDEYITVEAYVETVSSKQDTSSKAIFHPDSPHFEKVQKCNIARTDVMFSPTAQPLTIDQLSVQSGQLTIQEMVTLQQELPIALEISEFFCGAGLMSQGFKDAGFAIRLALDFDEPATNTHALNFPQTTTKCMDIAEFNRNRAAITPIIVGGPPCQGFSNANRTSHFLDNPKNKLVSDYVTTIQQSDTCQVFVLENVPQILTAGGGQFKDEILTRLDDYDISYGVLDASDFGSPQSRKRAIFIGSKIGKIELPEPTHGDQRLPKQTVGEAFDGLTDDCPNQQDYSIPKNDTVQKMAFVPQGGNWENIPDAHKNKRMLSGKTQSSTYKRLDETKPSITITNPRKSIITHPTQNRILSIRECARLFDLPDTFQFTGTLSQKQQQVANGVPAKLAKAIGLKIKNVIQKFNQQFLAIPSN